MKYTPLKDKEAQQKVERNQNLRRVSRAALVVLVGMTLSFFVLFLTRWGWPIRPHVPQLSLNELRNGTYVNRLSPLEWLENGENGQVLMRRPEGFVVAKWGQYRNTYKHVSNLTLKDTDSEEVFIDKLKLNKQLTYSLSFLHSEKHWRHSTYQQVYLTNLKSNQTTLVGKNISIAKFSPKGDSFAFVKDHNVFVQTLNGDVKQVTNDGSESVFNGIPDWVYEEEVFAGDEAVWWSAGGSTLAFMRTNDSLVNEFPIPYFIDGNKNTPAYPHLLNLKYPKPGFANPQVSLYVYKLGSSKPDLVNIDTKLLDPIISEVLFVGEVLVAKLMNREADQMEVYTVDTTSTSDAVLSRQYSESSSWFEVTHNARAVGTDGYIDTIDVNGFNHLALFSPATNSTPKVLTQGKWEVSDTNIAVNLDLRMVFFTGTFRSSRQNTVLAASLDKYEEPQQVAFINDGFYDVDFSADATFATVTYYAPEAPAVQRVVKLDFMNEHSVILEDNKELKELLLDRGLIVKEEPLVVYGEVLLKNNVTVNYREIRPSKFSSKHKYPVLFYNYGGPGSQMVQERLGLDFQRVFAEQHNAIVVTIDPRGTGKRGRNFRSPVRNHLGEFEAEDVINAASIWNEKPYVNPDYTSIWGWSYGGFLTLKVLERDVDLVFKYGVAVAPVTDWSLYDSVYTERYMHTPANNMEGYEKSKISNVTNIARHNRFLVMHGTGDDNVHFQNTLSLLDKLDLNGIENYDLHVFPDSDHAIAFHNANPVVYDKIDQWLGEHMSSGGVRGGPARLNA